jgi:ubiquinone/menaquinone biosynthesis C-methylase UbiE
VDARLSQKNWLTRAIDAYIHRFRANFYFKALSPHIKPDDVLLDVGAGDGLLTSRLVSAIGVREAHGFDVEPRALGAFPVKLYDGRHLPMPDQSVDVTICVTVLHHCDDAAQVLREIRRVTRKRFLLVEDRFDSEADKKRVIGFHKYLERVEAMPFDPRGFSHSKEWKNRLAAAGFDVKAGPIDCGCPLPWPMTRVPTTLFVAEPR